MIGVPEDYYLVLPALARFPAAIYSRDFAILAEIARNLTNTEDLLLRLLAERRHSSRADLISALASVGEGANALANHDVVVLCNFLLYAGHETTANLLGRSILHLLRERSHWNQLRECRKLLPNAIWGIAPFRNSGT